jgi:hypothetical protein
MPDSPVYEVKPQAKDGRKRLLHRNLLLPCDFLPLTPEPQEKTSPKSVQKKRKGPIETAYGTAEQCESDSDDSEILIQILPEQRNFENDSLQRKEAIDRVSVCLGNYVFVRKDRCDSRSGGGVAILCRDDWKVKNLDFDNNFECV